MAEMSLSNLSALPAELIDLILFEVSSVRDLSNFVPTSLFIYLRFESKKRAILFQVLQNELGPVLTDARFLFVLPYADPTEDVYYDRIHAMAAVYMCNLYDSNPVDGRAEPVASGLGEVTALCRTLHHINFLAVTYVTAQLRSFGNGGATSTVLNPASAPLSQTEWLRVLRAFYRRQIVSNAYASTKRYKHCDQFQDWIDEDVAAISATGGDQPGFRPGLFAAFEPWEVQQIDHVNRFLTRLCVALRVASLESRPIRRTEFGELFSHGDYLVRYLKEHRSLADTVLNTLSMAPGGEGGENLVVEETYRSFARPHAILPFLSAWQECQSQILPDPARTQRERDAEAIDFAGDSLNLIPFGWVDALDGRYANQFASSLSSLPWAPRALDGARCTRSDLWRDAGFTLWDRARVEAIKVLGWLKSLRTGWVVH